MSHSFGQVKFKDGLVLYYEYNGTVDIAIPALWNTPEEVMEHWRNQPNRKCICGEDERVVIATDYGKGFFWPGKACSKCMCITDGLGSGSDENLFELEQNGLPDWWLNT